MEKNEKSQPDYKFWIKLDHWSLKDAALLLNELDPMEYAHIKFNTREIPNSSELKEAYKTFLILKDSIRGEGKSYADSNELHPCNVCIIADKKDITLPKDLVLFLNKHMERNKKREEEQKIATAQHSPNEDLLIRERRNHLKIFGMFAHLLTEWRNEVYQFEISGRPNSHQIAKALLDKAISMQIEIDGIKSCNRKIAEGLKFLEEEGYLD